MKVSVKNQAGVLRETKIGFSWTIFFFGGFPFFFRGMPLHAVGFIIAGILTWGLSNIIMAFIGNKMTAKYYLENGYLPYGAGWDYAGPKWGILVEKTAP